MVVHGYMFFRCSYHVVSRDINSDISKTKFSSSFSQGILRGQAGRLMAGYQLTNFKLLTYYDVLT